MNAITLLKQDHGNVEGLFKRFEQLGPGAPEKAAVRDQIIEQLSMHATVEEQVLYPALRERVPEAADDSLEALEEHHLMKLALNELEKLAPTHERFDAKMTVLIENVRHHVEEEEQDGGLFDKLRDAYTVEELNAMGETMEKLKTASPKRPHPFLPDRPPFNMLLGPGVAVVDKVVNIGKGALHQLTRRAS